MESDPETVNKALSLIEAINLPHPSGSLLSSFVTDALNPTLAARYLIKRLSNGDALLAIQDWVYIIDSIQNGVSPPLPDAATQHMIRRRDGERCCVTGMTGTFWDPLLVRPILPVPRGWTENPSTVNMLGAFFGSPYRDWWLNYASSPEYTSPHSSHWLVRKSAAAAFAQGRVRLDRLQPSMLEYKINRSAIGLDKPLDINGYFPLLGDHSRSSLQKVDPRFVGTQARLSKSLQYLQLARTIAPEILRPISDSSLGSSPVPTPKQKPLTATWKPFRIIGRGIFGTFFSVWLMFPSRIRLTGYELLCRLGRFLYGKPADHSSVQKVPFGLYLKYQGESDGYRNEFNALHLARRYTSIPAPEPLDIVSRQGPKDLPQHDAYLLITEVPGIPLSRCHEVLSDADFECISKQMTEYISQLRKIPPLVNIAMPVCNALGEACRDTRIRGAEPVGPFENEDAFNQVLRFPDHPGRQGHSIVFTHADLNPRNILVGPVAQPDGTVRWSVTGIVDWENSGYYPEYWEFTKAMFEGFRWSARYNKLVKTFFKQFGGYEAELQVETMSWESGDAV